jgi:hypothetical protein
VPWPAVIVGRVKVIGGLQTADGRWRVEIVQHRRRAGYRLVHDGAIVHDLIGIGEVQTYLGRGGVNMADLIETPVTDNVGHPT